MRWLQVYLFAGSSCPSALNLNAHFIARRERYTYSSKWTNSTCSLLCFNRMLLVSLRMLWTCNKELSCRKETVLLLPNVTGIRYFADIIGLSSFLQPLWRNWPPNLSNSVKKRNLRAIAPFKVIQGHRCRYQSKARMRLPTGIRD